MFFLRITLLSILLAVLPTSAIAFPMGELSGMASFSKTNYGNNSYSTSRKYVGALGVYITSVTQIEGSYTTSETFFNYEPIQTSKVKEQTLALSVIQNLVPRTWFFQPYVKIGGAQYNRQQTGTVSGIPTTPAESKSPSAIVGGGVRLFLLRNFAIKGEGVSYLPDAKFKNFKDNFSVQAGISWSF